MERFAPPRSMSSGLMGRVRWRQRDFSGYGDFDLEKGNLRTGGDWRAPNEPVGADGDDNMSESLPLSIIDVFRRFLAVYHRILKPPLQAGRFV